MTEVSLGDLALYYFLSERRKLKLPALLEKVKDMPGLVHPDIIRMYAGMDNDSFMMKRLDLGYLMSDDLYAMGRDFYEEWIKNRYPEQTA